MQLSSYILVFLPKFLETRGSELIPPFLYLVACIAPAWAGFRARDGEHAVQRSRALMLSNVILALVMVLLGLDVLTFPTSFMRVGGQAGLLSNVIH